MNNNTTAGPVHWNGRSIQNQVKRESRMHRATATEYQTQHNIEWPSGNHTNTAKAVDTGVLPQHHHAVEYYHQRRTSDRTTNYEHEGSAIITADITSTTNLDTTNTAAAEMRATETVTMTNTITEGTTIAM